MSVSIQSGIFVIPAFKTFVPWRLQPWIYLFFAFSFQLSGGRYLGALNEMIGGQSLMREDLLMCLYCNLAGMAIYFPLLFRMKFRFTNKTLLTVSAWMVLLCNWASMHVTCLPLLWGICFLEGCFKIQGTFECMSAIQLWMTPRRDFTVFFPLLHIVILSSLPLSDYLTSWFVSIGRWQQMHWLVMGLMLVDLLILYACTGHFRFMRKFPLLGIDWAGMVLWAALLLQLSYLFDYGDWYDWWNSSVIRMLTGTSLITFGAALWRMFAVRHPFIGPAIWKFRYMRPIMLLITVVEALMGAEYVLEDIFLEEGLHYDAIMGAVLNGAVGVGALAGCLFSLWWMKGMRYSYVRLIMIGLLALIGYLVGMYFLISPHIGRDMLFGPLFCRGVASAILGISFLTSLHDVMSFQTFFQSLAVFQSLHLVIGGLLGAALYTRGLRYYVSEGFARYGAAIDGVGETVPAVDFPHFMEHFVENMEMIGIKRLYGWVIYACVVLLLLFLLYDAPARRDMKRMQSWRSLGRKMRRPFGGGKRLSE